MLIEIEGYGLVALFIVDEYMNMKEIFIKMKTKMYSRISTAFARFIVNSIL